MNNIFKYICILVICLAFNVNAQSVAMDLELMQQYFKKFEYDKVIEIADKIINSDNVSKKDLLKTYEMLAISHYSMNEVNESLKSFIEILKINPDYILDPVRTSPKIIHFYDEIKANFTEKIVEKTTVIQHDTLKLLYDSEKILRNAMVRSSILPGWGNFYLNDRKKGLLLVSLSTIAISSSIYFSIDCTDKRSEYLDEVNTLQIESKYDSYNRTFKIRNLCLTSFGVIWIYSQIDIWFFQHENIQKRSHISIVPVLGMNASPCLICFEYRF